MKFRYYITDTLNGEVRGTNSSRKAEEMAEWEEYFVVDTEFGQLLCPGESAEDVKEL